MKISYNRQNGASLIEVLVTVLLLATSLLAMAALQTRSLQYNKSSYFRSQANVLAYDVIDRIRLNRANYAKYAVLFGAAKPTGTSLDAKDIREWLTAIEGAVPGGQGQIECNANEICRVGVKWKELNSWDASSKDESAADTATEDYSTFYFSTRI